MKKKIIAIILVLFLIPSNTVFASSDLLLESSNDEIIMDDFDTNDLILEGEMGNNSNKDIILEDEFGNDSNDSNDNESIDLLDEIIVPKLKGLTLDKAEQILQESGIPADNVIYRYETTEDYKDETVISQSINEGSVYSDGDMLVVKLACAPINAVEDDELSLLCHFQITKDKCKTPSIAEDTWKDYPATYEYNWDNSENCWKWGIWGGNGNLKGYTTKYGTYDVNVRHKMCMYCDGDNVNLYIQYASCYGAAAMGDDFNFYIDGIQTKFRVIYSNGKLLTEPRSPGIYDVIILHGDEYPSSNEVLGSTGKIIVKKNNLNNELEISIPLEQMKKQNPRVNIEHFSKIDFFTPNLMYRHINCGGASSGPIGFAIIALIMCVMAYYIKTRNRGIERLEAVCD